MRAVALRATQKGAPRVSLRAWRTLLLVVHALVVAASVGVLWRFRPCTPAKHADASSEQDDDVRFEHQWPGGPKDVIVPGGQRDPCGILRECYRDPKSAYRTREECHGALPSLMRHYASTIALRGAPGAEEVVGFVSYYLERDPDPTGHAAVMIYNVCVAPDVRRKGVARRLMRSGLEALIEREGLDRSSLLLGLDVFLAAPMAAEAFALYMREGFVRGLQPCRSVADVDWRPLFSRRSPAAALSRMLADADAYVREAVEPAPAVQRATLGLLPSRTRLSDLRDGTWDAAGEERMLHYCMFRFYEDSWLALGQKIAAPFADLLPPPSDSE